MADEEIAMKAVVRGVGKDGMYKTGVVLMIQDRNGAEVREELANGMLGSAKKKKLEQITKTSEAEPTIQQNQKMPAAKEFALHF